MRPKTNPVVATVRALPPVLRVGFGTVVLGGVLDGAFHIGAMTGAGAELIAHLVTLAGMVIVVAHLLARSLIGVSASPPAREVPTKERTTP